MKPPVPYFGSKQGAAAWITGMLPPHEHYVEPFAGSLAVLLAKAPSPLETVNDKDRHLMAFWRVLRERPADLENACALTPHSRAEYDEALGRLETEIDDLERARLVWVILHQGRGRRLDGHEGWRHTVARSGPGAQNRVASVIGNCLERIAPAAERLRNVSLECLPALDLIGKYGAHPDVLLYIDPPYVGGTRNGSRRYGHEMPGESEHRQLAEALRACRASVVLSGYPSPLYDDLYEGWRREQKSVSTHNARPGERARIEALWSNRPLGAQGVLDFEAGAA